MDLHVARWVNAGRHAHRRPPHAVKADDFLADEVIAFDPHLVAVLTFDVDDFLARVLNENPALALEQIKMSRPAIEDSELDASLRFVLFLKETP